LPCTKSSGAALGLPSGFLVISSNFIGFACGKRIGYLSVAG
jgi:hypothetical protein